MSRLGHFMGRVWRDSSGGTVIEYTLIAGLIVIGLAAAMTTIGTSTQSSFETLKTEWDAAEAG